MGTKQTNADGLRWHFGTRRSGELANFGLASKESGSDKQLVVEIAARDFTAGTATYNGVTVAIPAGVTVREVIAEVTEAFTLTGTTPTVNVGVSGAETTNRLFQVTQAQAQAVGSYSLSTTGAGTLAQNTPLTAGATLNVALGGTTPTVSGTAGKMRVFVRYQDAQAAFA